MKNKDKRECFGCYVNSSSVCYNCEDEADCLKSTLHIDCSRPSKDEYYVNIALAVSKRSTCLKRHYGCVIVKDDVIVATGYNGSPRGCDNCCDIGICQRKDSERYSGYENCPAVHAEQNALLSTDRSHTQGATLYLACEDVENHTFVDGNPKPCSLCMRMIKNAGIKKIVNKTGVLKWD